MYEAAGIRTHTHFAIKSVPGSGEIWVNRNDALFARGFVIEALV
jgi:hypothetical protein